MRLLLTRSRIVLLAASVVVATGFARAQSDNPIDSVMDRDPNIPFPRVVNTFPMGAAESWIQALDRPVAETKVEAAQSIAMAHRQGMKGLDAAVVRFTRLLDRPDQHPTVRLAFAHALVALDARQSADSLFRALDSADAELREVIEPALARWDFKPIRSNWLDRLNESPPFKRRHLLAIESLAAVREEKAIPKVQALVLSPDASLPSRLAAARALRTLQSSGMEKVAAELAADISPRGSAGRLLGVTVLRNHAGADAIGLLQKLGQDSDPTVSAVALARLVELDTKLVVPLLKSVLASPDAAVRGFGVQTLFRQPDDAHIKLLGDRLPDPHPDVRGRARVALRELARMPEFNDAVIREGMRALSASDWRGQEQAAVLLSQLGHKPAGKRMLQLLRATRPEVIVSAAWGLRQLADPDNLPAVLEFVGEHHDKMLASGPQAGRRGVPIEAIDNQLAQLVQFLGQVRYRPAEKRLMAMLPRLIPGQPGSPPQTPVGAETRAAAVWALGLLNEGKSNPELVRALEARLNDIPMGPAGGEYDRVRQMAAISLGRMKAKSSIPSLQKFTSGKLHLDPVNNACAWALAQITGEPLPPAGVVQQLLPAWFLTPQY